MIINTRLENGCYVPEIPNTLASTAYHFSSPTEMSLISWAVPINIPWAEKVLPLKKQRSS